MFSVTRIYSDAYGDSHFEDITIPLKSNGEIGFLSDEELVKGIIFREVVASYDFDFHNAPQRQYIILLDGGVIIETSLGDIRTFTTGQILLVEDITGKGHKTKNIENKTRKSVFITL
ncbi:hypothetical protein Q765_01780 [Flavobacterium rivuli WB 3.3-2 = DSM 21788]|uniref:Cupin n=1 Tax=Flavobacterium rivuli WB 3.3-2 = DSM 21788 TaxID=1121895 RepID=A0A0A2MAM0_9FLAO|nr:hypothetical protein [Flavobacterium rivuli]KGO88656.1 hypothetical protein Q765_01780 [Flavobacterium rivuli WB 3.3-2 = DSM 21788]